MRIKNILITGGGGFVGSHLVEFLSKKNNFKIFVITKSNIYFRNSNIIQYIYIENLNHINLKEKLPNNIDCIIHLAGKAHSNFSYKEYYESNYLLTKKIYDYAVSIKLKKFIYLSTIKVNGEFSINNKPFTNIDKPDPIDNYAKTKYLAEKYILENSKNNETLVYIIRPPLILGRNVKGNIDLFIKLLKLKIPLPLKNINNKRSFLSIKNLNTFIEQLVFNYNGKNDIFLISDGYSISTSELFFKISYFSKIKFNNFYVNKFIIFLICNLLFLKKYYQKLFFSQEIDIEYTKRTVNWKPKEVLDQTLESIFNE